MAATSPPDTGATPTPAPSFAAGRGAPARRPLRSVARTAGVIFAAAALIALVTNDRGPDDVDLAIVSPPASAPVTPAPTAAPATPAAPTGGAGSGGSSGVGGGSGGSTGSPATPSPPPTSPAPQPGPGAGDPATPRTTVPPPVDVAVVSPVLRIFAFGSKVGMPLLCSVAIAGVVSQVSDPAVAQVAATVASSCVSYGNQGNEALTELNAQLAALEAANPAVAPVVDALAQVFNTAGSQDVPFTESLTALGTLISFFG